MESGTDRCQFILFWVRKMNLLLAHEVHSITRRNLLVQSKQSKHQNNVLNLSNGSDVFIINFEQISRIILVMRLLTYSKFLIFGENLLEEHASYWLLIFNLTSFFQISSLHWNDTASTTYRESMGKRDQWVSKVISFIFLKREWFSYARVSLKRDGSQI